MFEILTKLIYLSFWYMIPLGHLEFFRILASWVVFEVNLSRFRCISGPSSRIVVLNWRYLTNLLPELCQQINPLLLEEPIHGLHGLHVHLTGRWYGSSSRRLHAEFFYVSHDWYYCGSHVKKTKNQVTLPNQYRQFLDDWHFFQNSRNTSFQTLGGRFHSVTERKH